MSKINNIPFLDILNKLGYRYKTKGDVIYMYDGDRMTDGWRGSIEKGFLKCHSGLRPGRFEGDRLGIIKSLFNLDDAGAFKWYEETFNLEKTFKKKEMTNIKFDSGFSGMEELTKEQLAYLRKRNAIKEGDSLSLSYLKNNGGYITIEVKTENGTVIGTQGRNPFTTDKKDRYRINGSAAGLFMQNYNPNKKELYIVEGFTDFITANSLGLNVIGLVSASVNPEILKAFHRKHNLIIIPDNDEAGEKWIEKARGVGLNFGIYSVSTFGEELKDFNDLVNNIIEIGGDLKEIENIILSYVELPLTNLQLALKKAKTLKEAGTILIGDPVFDLMTAGVGRGKTMLINGPSGQGKTTLSLYLQKCLLKRGDVKVNYYSLETDVGTQLCQTLAFLNGTTTEHILSNLSLYEKQLERLSNLELYDDIRTFEGITNHIKENKPDVAIIDFAQKVSIEGANEKEKMINYAQGMQNFAIDNQVTGIISLSQTAMTNYQTPILQRTPKDSGALFESSDTTINVGRDENGKWVVAFLKTKNIGAKGWYKVCDTNYNMATGEYIIFNPEEAEKVSVGGKKSFS